MPALWIVSLLSMDVSPQGGTVDPRRFTLVRKVALGRASIVSPSGEFLAQYSGNDVQLVELSKKTKVQLAGHTQNIHDGGWSRNGRILATSAYDGTVRAWDVEKGREIFSVSPHAGYA